VAVGGVAAAAALAVTASVLTGTVFSADADSPSGTGNSVVMAAMQRDLSLTADASSARLKKDAWASGVEKTLRTELGTTFGGAWMTKDGTDLMVAVTSKDAAATVTAAGAVPKLVERNEIQLNTFKKTLDNTTTAAGVTGWYVDPPTNTVVVVAKTGKTAAARNLAAAADLPTDAVRVTTTKDAPRLMADLKGGEAYIIDDQFRCSVGFAVVGGFVTAGHCGAVGAVTTGVNDEPQGVTKASVFPGNADMGFVAVTGDFTPQPVVATDQGDIPVAGSTEAPIGAAICRTGSTTGTRCGVVESKNETVVYPEGAVTGLTRTDACAEGGDSGGSWLAGDQAQGVTSGGSGDCTVGGETFFQPIAEILAVNKLQLITTDDATPPVTDPPVTDPPATDPPATTDPAVTEPPATDPPATDPPATDPPATDPPATECPPAEKKLTGALSQRGAQDVVGFRARSGTHNACLTSPAGSDFDLSLQRLTGRKWRTVATAAGDLQTEQLTFTGRGGRYRYTVESAAGSGEYVLGVDVP
jgi:streptogrisin C